MYIFVLNCCDKQACAIAQIAGFNMGPEDLLKNMQDHADAFNTPRVGTYNNYAFTAFQLNIAPAIKYAIRECILIWDFCASDNSIQF